MISDEQARAAIPKRGWCAAYCEWAEYVTDAPLVFHLGSALAVMSLAVPPHVGYTLGAVVPGTIWSMLVGTAGATRKSTALRMAREMVVQAAPHLVGLRGQESTAQLVSDIEERPQSIMFESEYGAWLSKTGPRSYRADMRDFVTDLWEGEVIEKRGKSSEPIRVERPRISQLVAVAPGMLDKHTDPLAWTDGFMSRWQIWFGAPATVEKINPPSWEVRRIELVELLTRTIERRVGECVGMEPEAAMILQVWKERHAAERGDTRHAWKEPVYARAPTAAYKNALVYACDFGAGFAARGRPWKIDAESMYWATRAVDLHLASVSGVLAATALTAYAQKQRSVLDAIEGHVMRSEREVMRRVMPPLPKREVDQIVESLVFQGIVHVQDAGQYGRYLCLTQDGVNALAGITEAQLAREAAEALEMESAGAGAGGVNGAIGGVGVAEPDGWI